MSNLKMEMEALKKQLEMADFEQTQENIILK